MLGPGELLKAEAATSTAISPSTLLVYSRCSTGIEKLCLPLGSQSFSPRVLGESKDQKWTLAVCPSHGMVVEIRHTPLSAVNTAPEKVTHKDKDVLSDYQFSSNGSPCQDRTLNFLC